MQLNRPYILMIIGGLLVVALLAVWVYLLFFRTAPEQDDRFANLDLGPENDPALATSTPEAATSTEDRPRVALGDGLQQLTTTPVAGFREVARGSSSAPLLFYVDAGTGHIHTIDMETGERTRRSNLTIPDITQVNFSPDGTYVAGLVGEQREKRLFVAALATSSEQIDPTYVTDLVLDFAIMDTERLLYTTRTNSGTDVKSVSLADLTSEDLFSTVLRDVTIAWGQSATATHYFYPKPSRWLEGSLYAVRNGVTERVPARGLGLTAVAFDTGVAFNHYDQDEREYIPQILRSATATRPVQAPVVALPEKCTASRQQPTVYWCGHESVARERALPDVWYRGEVSFSDTLWRVNARLRSAVPLVDLETESGRPLDVTALAPAADETGLYFIDKNDRTLWHYDIP